MEDDLKMEIDLKILKVEYLSNHYLELLQILNLSSGDQTKIKNAWTEDDLQWKTTSKWKMTSKYWKLNISATTSQTFLKF
jgi:hypothetical protein